MENKKFYNLTNPQKNIYMREEFYKDTSINNISFNLYFENYLDEKIIQKVLNKMIEKNDGLRIRLEINGSDIKQYVEEYEHEEFPVKNYKNKQKDEVMEELEEDANIPFIIKNRKLYKFVVYRLKNDATIIHVKLHHIISDAWAGKLFCDQFAKYYRAFNGEDIVNKKTHELETSQEILDKSKPSYLDFIESENNYLNSIKYEKDKEYWEEYVKDLPEAVSFKENATKKTSVSKRYSKELKVSNEIKQYCEKHNVSPFSFFVATYAIYIYKTQSKNAFTIGTPLLNRKNKKEKKTFGVFISTVPIKIHIEDNDTIQKLIKKISTQLMSALRHESYPYEEIQDYVYSKKNENTNLFDTIISFQNAIIDTKIANGRLEVLWNYAGNQQTSFEFNITDHNDTGTYTLSLDYNENYCDEIEIEFVFNRMQNIIKQIIKDSGEGIQAKKIELLDKKEKEMVLKKFNNLNNYNPNKTIIQLLEEQVARTKDNIALQFNSETLTYGELNNRVNIFANKLIEAGVNGNEPICIVLERSLDMIVAMLGTLKAGAYYVTIDPAWPLERAKYIMEDVHSRYVITHKKNEKLYNDINKIFVEDMDYTGTIDNPEIDIKMNDYVYGIYTSGSTGKPKGTMITNTNLNNLLHSSNKNFNQDENDVWVLFHTYTFDFSAWEIYGSLTTGGKLIIVPKDITTNPQKMVELLIDEKITILNLTPAYFYKLLDAEKMQERRFKNLRFVDIGGEAVYAEPLKYWKEKYPEIPIYNIYGPTETTIFAIMGEMTDKDIEENNVFLGKPFLNYNITIVNKKGEPLGIGLEGEMCITGKSVCGGYFNNEKMTKEKFVETENGRLYKTGDVGYWNVDGRIKYIGRNDNQVKIRGFRIELEEIEKELLKCEAVTKAIVFPIENSNYTKSLVGFIEATEKNYEKKAIEIISKQLTSYMIPKLYQVESLPLNDNGKVDRRKLIEKIKESTENRKIIQPRNKVENDIYEVICEIKNMSQISINDDFFKDLGLDSLDVMRMATSLAKYSVEIQKINNNPTIEKLAIAISNKQKDVEYITKLYDTNVTETKFKYNLSNVFLTGGAGFLGIHILKELIFNSKIKNIYCLIRPKGKTDPTERLKNTFQIYFEKYNDRWLDKITVVPGDFEKEFLGLDETKYKNLCDNITTIIHCGANVKHFGNYESFYQTNVIGTENIIKMAYDSNAKLAHISTISVGGYSKRDTAEALMERNINVSQQFNNHVYMITKYEAECKVLDAVSKGWISAKIFRLGNIMPRVKDGKFQKNKYDNGFLARMKTIMDMKGMTNELAEYKIDLSPVDLCAKCIMSIFNIRSARTILHIYNKNTIKVKRLFKKEQIEEIPLEEAVKRIKENGNPYDAHLLNDILNYEYTETPVTCKLTSIELLKAGFRWNKINDKYIEKIMNIVKSN